MLKRQVGICCSASKLRVDSAIKTLLHFHMHVNLTVVLHTLQRNSSTTTAALAHCSYYCYPTSTCSKIRLETTASRMVSARTKAIVEHDPIAQKKVSYTVSLDRCRRDDRSESLTVKFCKLRSSVRNSEKVILNLGASPDR